MSYAIAGFGKIGRDRPHCHRQVSARCAPGRHDPPGGPLRRTSRGCASAGDARARAKSATARKVRVSNYRNFAKLVSTTTKNFDPKHSNLVMHTDGTIAVLYFDFVFNVDGKANNRGSETWQLVKSADGWRIASIVYSSEPPAQQWRLFLAFTQ